MKTALAPLGVLVACGLVTAAGRDAGPAPAGPPVNPSDAQAYSRYLMATVDTVAANYIRPVAPADLVANALAGLCAAARQPVPPSLRAELRRATTPSELAAVAYRVRLRLGDVDGIRGDDAVLASARAMARGLDPYSTVATRQEMAQTASGNLTNGIGMQVADQTAEGAIEVQVVDPGSPAQRAGIRPGDRISQVGGQPVTFARLAQLRLLLGSRGNVLEEDAVRPPVALTLIRPGGRSPRRLSLQPEVFRPESVLGVARRPDNSWDYWLDPKQKLAHVRVSGLLSGTSEELAKVLADLRAGGLRGLILDLRWCPGGFLEQAQQAPRLFLASGTIATLRYRDPSQNELYRVTGGSTDTYPIVVLVNGASSGGAELIAAALQDNGRALVAGQRTRGKASVQKPFPLHVGETYLRLTTGEFVRPSGKNLHRSPESKPADDWGVRPDAGLELRVSPDVDRQLREWWLLQTLRPGSSNEALPLDDPAGDPQRQIARVALERRLAKPATPAPRLSAGR